MTPHPHMVPTIPATHRKRGTRARYDEMPLRATRSLPFITFLRGTLVHRVRDLHVTDDGEFHATLWCGMQAYRTRKSSPKMRAEPGTRPVCATCQGRAEGAGQIPQRKPPQTSFIGVVP